MIIVILVGVLIGLFVFFAILLAKEEKEFGFLVFMIFFTIIISMSTWGRSYSTYLDARAFYSATIEQYRGQVTLYEDYAKLDMTAYTDFRGQGYQKEMSDKIATLSAKITEYNEVIIKKRIMGKNLWFSWLIIEPDDDMVVINLIEKKR